MATLPQAPLAAGLVGKRKPCPAQKATHLEPAKPRTRTNCSVRSRVYKCEPVEVAKFGCPHRETRRGMVEERPQLCVCRCAVLWGCGYMKKTHTKKNSAADGCVPPRPARRIRPIVGCVIHARTAEPCVK